MYLTSLVYVSHSARFQLVCPVYFISMVKNASVTVTATAYDTDDKVIISHTINGVSLVPNKKTIATGTFFQSSGSGTFTVNSEWLTDNNIEY